MDVEKSLLSLDESEDNNKDVTETTSSTANPQILLTDEIKNNISGCDLVICLFMAALRSYRADKCLRPFPNFYMIDKDEKNFNLLRTICDEIPALDTIITNPNKCSKEVVKLLSWLLLQKGYPVLKRRQFDCVKFPTKILDTYKPQYVFEVCYCDKSEDVWKKRLNGRETILAYHGSRIENFYSILRVGLQQYFSYEKEVLYGNGVYLSKELSISTNYSPYGHTWNESSLGNKHSVIAICEIINDVNKVKCRDVNNRQRANNINGYGQIPENYFVVTDSDMVRVKYLMVYREHSRFSVKSFILQNMFLFSMILYLMVIIFVGFYTKSSSIFRWFQ